MLTKPTTCMGCPLYDLGQGFMETTGSGSNQVLLVGEALGEQEALEGKPFVGKSGAMLDKMLARGGMDRSAFWVSNVIWCRPPNNKLVGEYYEAESIKHCAPYLDDTIHRLNPKCIVTLGVTAFKRVIPEIAFQYGVGLLDSKGKDGKGKKGARGYTFYSERYSCWVVPTVHPAFVVRGKTAWTQVIIHDIQRGTEIAANGYQYDAVDYLLDPAPFEAMKWVKEFESYYQQNPETILSCDIETTNKGSNEEDLELDEDSNYTITRCAYSYKDFHGMSIPWDGQYRSVHERLMGSNVTKVFWNAPFDVPRILAS